MRFELPDFWTTLGIGLALLSLVPGMTSVPSASHIEFKISRLCALAAATLFLVKLALWGAEDLTAVRLLLVALLGALIAVSAAYALHWINKKELKVRSLHELRMQEQAEIEAILPQNKRRLFEMNAQRAQARLILAQSKGETELSAEDERIVGELKAITDAIAEIQYAYAQREAEL